MTRIEAIEVIAGEQRAAAGAAVLNDPGIKLAFTAGALEM